MTRSEFAAILVLTACVASFFGPAIFGDRAVFTWNMDRWLPWAASASADDLARPTRLADCARQFAVMRETATDAAREGRVPLWNRHLFCGTPFLANFQPGVFYPANAALSRSGWSVPDQMTAFAAVHLWWGALGVFVLLRAFGTGSLAALLAAIVFAWGAPNASRTGLPTLLATASWLPWIVLMTRRWFERGGALAWGGMAAALALAGLAGFAQLFVFVGYTGAIAAIVFGVGRRGPGSLRGWVLGACAGVVGLGLVGIHLVPTIEFARLAQDATNSRDMLASGTLHPWILAKFLVPDLFGSPVDDSSVAHLLRVGSGYYFQTEWTTAIYVGVLPWLLAAWVALAPLDRRRETFFALAITTLGLLLSIRGPWTPILTALPGLSFSRPDRATILIAFGLSLATGLGAHALAGREGPDLRRPANALALGLGALALLFTVTLALAGRTLLPPRIVEALGPTAVARAAWLAAAVVATTLVLVALRAGGRIGGRAFLLAAIAIVGASVGWTAVRANVMQPKTSIFRAPLPGSALEFLQARAREDVFRIFRYEPGRNQFFGVLPPSTAAWYGLDDVLGFDSINTKAYEELVRALDPDIVLKRGNFRGTERADVLDSPLLDLLNVRYVLAAAATELPGLQLVHQSDLCVYENENALPRAFLVEDVRPPVPPARLADASFRPELRAYADVSLPEAATSRPDEPLGAAELVDVRDERVHVRVAASRPALLVLTDADYPGWTASIDGVERPIHRVDHVFRGVVVGPGDSDVVFEYRPRSFRTGAGLTLLALAGWIVGIVALSRGRRLEVEPR